MNKDMSRCAALFCPLEHDCERKDYVGKPYDDRMSMADFSNLLETNEDGFTLCPAQVTK